LDVESVVEVVLLLFCPHDANNTAARNETRCCFMVCIII
jgi:hypothetical protein